MEPCWRQKQTFINPKAEHRACSGVPPGVLNEIFPLGYIIVSHHGQFLPRGFVLFKTSPLNELLKLCIRMLLEFLLRDEHECYTFP